ncbi:MAG TPA: hypothetical protein VFS21_36435 [Roseiflexaceae bacterium]|nr:hypothetical protein [Roseiflexaceae bacterium]
MQPVYQFAAGEDGVPSTPDDQVIGVADSYTTGSFVFSIGAPGVIYRLTILVQDQKLGLVPAPYRVGDDRTIDNDLHTPDPTDPSYWTTDGFELTAGVTTTDIDLGFCQIPVEHVYLPLVQR